MGKEGVIVAVVVVGGVTVAYFAIPEVKEQMDKTIFNPIRDWLEERGFDIGGNTRKTSGAESKDIPLNKVGKNVQDVLGITKSIEAAEKKSDAEFDKQLKGATGGYPIGQCFQIQKNGQLIFCFRNKRCGGSMVSVCGRSKSVPCSQVRADWIKFYGCKARAGRYYKVVS